MRPQRSSSLDNLGSLQPRHPMHAATSGLPMNGYSLGPESRPAYSLPTEQLARWQAGLQNATLPGFRRSMAYAVPPVKC